jgi:hypothetical protein
MRGFQREATIRRAAAGCLPEGTQPSYRTGRYLGVIRRGRHAENQVYLKRKTDIPWWIGEASVQGKLSAYLPRPKAISGCRPRPIASRLWVKSRRVRRN